MKLRDVSLGNHLPKNTGLATKNYLKPGNLSIRTGAYKYKEY